MEAKELTRVVTGKDANGRSRIDRRGPAPTIVASHRAPQSWIAEQWTMDVLPPDLEDDRELAAGPWQADAPQGGMGFRTVQFAPVGEPGCESPAHATETLDCVVVISGRIVLQLDDEEIELGPGDSVVQRATRHAWINRGAEPAVIAAVLVSTTDQLVLQTDSLGS